MTDSLIHAAFDPRPYVLVSISAISLGMLLEVNWTSNPLRRLARDLPRTVTRHASRVRDRSGFLKIAKR